MKPTTMANLLVCAALTVIAHYLRKKKPDSKLWIVILVFASILLLAAFIA